MDDSALAARIRTQAEELNATIMAARASGITVSLYVRTESVVGWHETDGVYVKAIRREL